MMPIHLKKPSNQTLNARVKLCDRLQIVISMLRELDVQLNVSHTIQETMTDSIPDWSLSSRSTQTHTQLCQFCTLIITAVTDRKLFVSKRQEKEERRKRKSNILLLRFLGGLVSLHTQGLIYFTSMVIPLSTVKHILCAPSCTCAVLSRLKLDVSARQRPLKQMYMELG